MDELIASFRQRGDRYVDQCDALYAVLIEPFLILKEPVREGDEDQVPLPSFMLPGESVRVDDKLPPELLEL